MTVRPKILLRDSYFAMIENSVGTRMFRSLYARIGRQCSDILRNGELSCAYFTSSVLKIHGLIDGVHATVAGTVRDMEHSGWRRMPVRRHRRGSVVVWESRRIDGETHKHIGFLIGRERAVSISAKKRGVARHHETYGGKRKIEAVYWNRKLDR